MLTKIKTFCLNSLTIAWSYLLALVGVIFQLVDTAGDVLDDPGFKDQVSAAIGNPTWAGRALLFISIITLAARLRSIRKPS